MKGGNKVPNVKKLIEKMKQQPIKQENPIKKAYVVDVLSRIGE